MKFYNHKKRSVSGLLIAVMLMMQLTGCASSKSPSIRLTMPEDVPDASAADVTAPPQAHGPLAGIVGMAGTTADEPPEPQEPDPDDVEPDTDGVEPDTGGVTPSAIPTVAIQDDTIIDLGDQRVYGFRNTGYVGCGLDGTVMPYELYYGIYLKTNGSELTYRPYSYVDGVEPIDALIARSDDSEAFTYLTVDTNNITVDLRKQLNGLFIVMFQFSNDEICYGYIYVNDGNAYVVSVTTWVESYVRKTIMTKADKLQALADADGITPENSLSVDMNDICYPVWNSTTSNYRCDTDLWRELAHKIVPDDTLPDTLKVIMLHDWITANLAYDNYVAHNIDVSRQTYYKDYSGAQSVYNLKTGVCRDFVNIFAIMCRELGIPCTDISSDKLNHTWSLVYLNGEWRDLDLTKDVKREVNGQDTTDITNNDVTIAYDTFLLSDKFARAMPSDTEVGHGIYSYNDVRYGFD